MKKLTPEQAWGRSGLMAVSAVRYCLGRRTYIVSDCQEWLCNIWDKLPEKAKAVIERDVEEAFKSDDEDRANGKDYRALGHDCDRRCWEQVRKLWRNDETRPVHKSAEVGRHLVSNPAGAHSLEACGLNWDTNDPEPPACKKVDRRTKKAREAAPASCKASSASG